MDYKILTLWELAYMCGHFHNYSPKDRYFTSIGEIAVMLQNYGFKMLKESLRASKDAGV